MANEGDADLPKHTIDDIVARGQGTQFKPGNKAAKGHGKGRPRKLITQAQDKNALHVMRFLRKIMDDKTHPMHDRYQFRAAVELGKLSIPKRREHTGAGGEKLNLVDAHELVYGKRKDDEDDDD